MLNYIEMYFGLFIVFFKIIFSFMENNDRFWKRTFRFELSKNEKR